MLLASAPTSSAIPLLPSSSTLTNIAPTASSTSVASTSFKRKSSRAKSKVDYANLHEGVGGPKAAGFPDWASQYAAYEQDGRIRLGGYKEVEGEEVTPGRMPCGVGWESEEMGVMSCPVVVRGLGGIEKMGGGMPKRDLTVREISEINGASCPFACLDTGR